LSQFWIIDKLHKQLIKAAVENMASYAIFDKWKLKNLDNYAVTNIDICQENKTILYRMYCLSFR
jgi:hypothetical protein